jgi:putative FmdB family regulatory protein
VPLYEYQCAQCGRFELIRKFSDPVLTACPTCGKEVQKLASAPAIQFKGTGWYVTDYARKGSGGDGAASSSSKDGSSKEAAKDTPKDTASSSPSKDTSKDSSASGSSPSK